MLAGLLGSIPPQGKLYGWHFGSFMDDFPEIWQSLCIFPVKISAGGRLGALQGVLNGFLGSPRPQWELLPRMSRKSWGTTGGY